LPETVISPETIVKQPPKSYIKGIEDNEVIKEVRRSTNKIYPIKEGKIYISVDQVLDHVRENETKYKLLNCIKSNQYLKSIISEIYRVRFKWERYSRKESRKSVYVRQLTKESK
jgi:hypothetical protein